MNAKKSCSDTWLFFAKVKNKHYGYVNGQHTVQTYYKDYIEKYRGVVKTV